MFSLRCILLACLSLSLTEAYDINYPPCSIKDNECVIDLFQKVFNDLADTGIPEINLPSLDPMKLSNISIKVLDEIVIFIKEGVVKGFKNCKINSFNIDLEKQLAIPEIYCEVLTIKGHFVIEGSSPLLQSVFGTTSIKGEGKTKIKLEKLTVGLETPVSVIKKEDGHTYFKVLTNKPKYTYDIKKVTFEAKNLVIGKTDLSQIVTAYVNENWKTLLNTYGKEIVDKAILIVFEHIHTFYDNINSEKFIKDDLTPYIKN